MARPINPAAFMKAEMDRIDKQTVEHIKVMREHTAELKLLREAMEKADGDTCARDLGIITGLYMVVGMIDQLPYGGLGLESLSSEIKARAERISCEGRRGS